jgi:hypothetical protein
MRRTRELTNATKNGLKHALINMYTIVSDGTDLRMLTCMCWDQVVSLGLESRNTVGGQLEASDNMQKAYLEKILVVLIAKAPGELERGVPCCDV